MNLILFSMFAVPVFAQVIDDFAIYGDGSQMVALDSGNRLLAVTAGSKSVLDERVEARFEMSQDGRVLLLRGSPGCQQCGFGSWWTLRAPGQPDRPLQGSFRLSRSGKFLLQNPGALSSPSVLYRIDVATLERILVGPHPDNFLQFADVASEGTVLFLSQDQRVGIFRNARVDEYDAGTVRTQSAFLDEAGTVAVFTRSGPSLSAMDLGNGSVRTLAEGYSAAGLSSNGFRALAFREKTEVTYEVASFELSSGELKALRNPRSGVRRARLSADGRFAALLTVDGHLMRLSLDEDKLEPWLACPRFDSIPAGAPGGLVDTPIRVADLLESENYEGPTPWPGELAGIAIRLGEQRLPIHSLRMDPRTKQVMVRFQLPWDVSPGTPLVAIDTRWPTVPSTGRNMIVSARRPEVLFEEKNPGESGIALAYHEESGDRVTDDKPGRAGERIRIRMTGLGGVPNPPPLGEPAPTAITVEPVACRLYVDQSSVLVTSEEATLVAGEVGVYEILLRLPNTLTASTAFLSCGMQQAPRLPIAP